MTSVAALLAAHAEDDRVGVMDGDGRWTWRQAVHEGATRGALATSLFGHAKPHIGVLLPNGAEYLFWLNAAALAGAAIVGINPTRRGEALAADVRATDCAMIVTDDEGAAPAARGWTWGWTTTRSSSSAASATTPSCTQFADSAEA